jgi:hypothetical protein
VDVKTISARLFLAELADGLEEWEALDIADGAANFDQHEIIPIIAGTDEVLDGVRHMRNHLHGPAQKVAAPFLGDDFLIDPAGGDVVLLVGVAPREALIMAKVEVGLGPVIGDKHFAMLIRAHGARIDVEIGVKLAQADRKSARLQQRTQCRRSQAFAKGRDHAASDENISRHGILPYPVHIMI